MLESEVEGRLATVRLISEGQIEIYVDLLFASSGIEKEVVDRAELIEIFPGLIVKVASLPSLIALKVLSANIKSRPQDVIDLGNLINSGSDEDMSEAFELVGLITSRGYNRNKDLYADLEAYIDNSRDR